MKKTFLFLVALGLFVSTSVRLHAQHYPAGSEGVKGATLPPTGLSIEDYNSFYYADQLTGFGAPANQGFHSFSYTQAPRLIWMTGWNILGAEYGMAIRVPVAYKEVTFQAPVVPPGSMFPPPMGGPTTSTTHSQFGLEDIQIEPLMLSWHLSQFDIISSYSVWVPTGDYDESKAYLVRLGGGYWTHMLTLGVTWYPDTEKEWAISLLNRYEINTEQHLQSYQAVGGGTISLDDTPGDFYTLEWAVSKRIFKHLDVGLTGYYQQQVTDTKFPSNVISPYLSSHIDVAGIGPEIDMNCPKWKLTGSLRYAYEFTATEHSQGHLVTLTITKSF